MKLKCSLDGGWVVHTFTEAFKAVLLSNIRTTAIVSIEITIGIVIYIITGSIWYPSSTPSWIHWNFYMECYLKGNISDFQISQNCIFRVQSQQQFKFLVNFRRMHLIFCYFVGWFENLINRLLRYLHSQIPLTFGVSSLKMVSSSESCKLSIVVDYQWILQFKFLNQYGYFRNTVIHKERKYKSF